MAKSIKFDRQDVILKAMNLFWEKGFHATSMRDLQTALDMRPGSIYAAFGSKEGLFELTLEAYTEQAKQGLASFRAQESNQILALKAFVTSLVIDSMDQAPSCICMLAKTLAELTPENQALLNQVKASLSQVEVEFEDLLAMAQAQGDLNKEKDPKQLARYFQVQIAGLRTYNKLQQDKDLIKQMIEQVFASL